MHYDLLVHHPMAHDDRSTVTTGGKERIARVEAHLTNRLLMMSGDEKKGRDTKR